MAEQPVRVFTAADQARIARAVRRVEQMPQVLAARNALTQQPTDSVLVRNVSGYAAPQYGLAWLCNLYTDGVAYRAEMPDGAYLYSVGIFCAPVAVNSYGRVWIAGRHPLRITGWAGMVAADFPFHATTQADSFDAVRHFGDGGIRCLALSDTSPLVLAELRN